MKRIEVVVPSEKRSSVVNAIIKAGASGVTVSETKGRGSGERPTVRGARGTSTYVAEFNKTDTITTIIDDSKQDSIISSIMDAAHTGTKGDGKIFISSIEDAIDIATKRKESL